jgi:hypothetical protein
MHNPALGRTCANNRAGRLASRWATMKPHALALVMLMLPCIGLAQTLCRASEIDYFSCETTANEKILSVCGNITNGEIDG